MSTGSAGMMEVCAGKLMWMRSLKLHSFRYTTMLSDGDSKLYNEIVRLNPYGDEFPVNKEECINHVGKRLGTALRNLVQDLSKKGVTIGGNGHGRLTQVTIAKLQKYYTRAIRKHDTAAQMKKAIYASLNHCFSTDDNPLHSLCPTGENSWCFYNSSLAKHRQPKPHKTLVHTPLDKALIWPHIKPVYERLTSEGLLARCELKGTQNSNESMHSVVWSKCPKIGFFFKEKGGVRSYSGNK